MAVAEQTRGVYLSLEGLAYLVVTVVEMVVVQAWARPLMATAEQVGMAERQAVEAEQGRELTLATKVVSEEQGVVAKSESFHGR